MKLTGHSSKPVHKNYTHLEIDTLKSAIAALDKPSQTAPTAS